MRQRKKKPLEEGKVYCKHCKGNGLVKYYKIKKYYKPTNKCKYCNGSGQMFWIDFIIGKKLINEDELRIYKKNSITSYIWGQKTLEKRSKIMLPPYVPHLNWIR